MAAANIAFCTLCMRAALERRRDQVRPQQRDVAALVVERDHLAVDARLERAGAAAGADVLAHQSRAAGSS